MATIHWNRELVDQLDWHYTNHARPRLEGLSDAEYMWEPVPGWNVRRKTGATPPGAPGSGRFTIDFVRPEPVPAPVTTISWRLMHVVIAVLGQRSASHFGAPAVDYQSYDYPGTASVALERLDGAYALWTDGVRSLGADGLHRECGPAEGTFAKAPMAALVLHINREMIHHLAEIALLRDLYLHEH